MTAEWITIALVAGGLALCGIAFVLGACRAAGSADDRQAKAEADFLALWGDQHPHGCGN